MASITQYTGSRYVPIFADPAEWNSTRTYEPLTIVLNEGNSYTSRQFVPVGVELTNTDYWLETGNYNAQVEQYRQDVLKLEGSTKYFETIADAMQATHFENEIMIIGNGALAQAGTTQNANNIFGYKSSDYYINPISGTFPATASIAVTNATLNGVTYDLNNYTLTFNGNFFIYNGGLKNGNVVCASTSYATGVIVGDYNVFDNITFSGSNAFGRISHTEIGNCVINTENSCIACYPSFAFDSIHMYGYNNIHDCSFPYSQTKTNSLRKVQFSNVTIPFTETQWSNKEQNLIIKNCSFGPVSIGRALSVVNFSNVEISGIEVNNNQIRKNIAGGSDDPISIDVCNNVTCSNITVNNSGENGFDILGSTNVTVTNLNLYNIPTWGLSIDHSDVVVDTILSGHSVTDYPCENIIINNVNITTISNVSGVAGLPFALVIVKANGVYINGLHFTGAYTDNNYKYLGMVDARHNASLPSQQENIYIVNSCIVDTDFVNSPNSIPNDYQTYSFSDNNVYLDSVHLDESSAPLARVEFVRNESLTSGVKIMTAGGYHIQSNKCAGYVLTNQGTLAKMEPLNEWSNISGVAGMYGCGTLKQGTQATLIFYRGRYISVVPEAFITQAQSGYVFVKAFDE